MSGRAILSSSTAMSDPVSVRVISSVGKYVETEDFVEVDVGLCVDICGDVLLGVISDSVAGSRVVGKEVVGSGVEADLRVLGLGVEREVIASRVVILIEVDSRVVESGVVDLRVVVSRLTFLRVVGSYEVVSGEMVLGVLVVSGSNIFVVVGAFVISVVVGFCVVLDLAVGVSGFADVLILPPPTDELEVISLPLPPPPISSTPTAAPTAPSVVASPLLPSLVVADSPSVVRGLSA